MSNAVAAIGIDWLYGKNRFDVTTWTGDSQNKRLMHERVQWNEYNAIDITMLLSDDYIGGKSGVFYERGGIAREGDLLAVTCYAVEWYNAYDGNGVKVTCLDADKTPLASGLDLEMLDYIGSVVMEIYRRGSLERFIGAAGISRERVVPIRLMLFWDDFGYLHLWGVDRSGTSVSQASASTNETAPAPSSQNEVQSAPANGAYPYGVKPQVTPDALSPE